MVIFCRIAITVKWNSPDKAACILLVFATTLTTSCSKQLVSAFIAFHERHKTDVWSLAWSYQLIFFTWDLGLETTKLASKQGFCRFSIAECCD